MIDREDELSVNRQCELLALSRGSCYYRESGSGEKEQRDREDLKLIAAVLELIPIYGYRRVSRQLLAGHPHLTEKAVRRVMNRFGRKAIYPGPKTSASGKEHEKYPYLLRGKR